MKKGRDSLVTPFRLLLLVILVVVVVVTLIIALQGLWRVKLSEYTTTVGARAYSTSYPSSGGTGAARPDVYGGVTDFVGTRERRVPFCKDALPGCIYESVEGKPLGVITCDVCSNDKELIRYTCGACSNDPASYCISGSVFFCTDPTMCVSGGNGVPATCK